MIAQIDRHFIRYGRSRTAARALSYSMFEGRPATAPGHWLNPIVGAHLKAALKIRQRQEPCRPIFVLGVGRSGTSLLGRLMAVHPDVGFLNEPKLMWHLLDPVEDVSGFYNRSSIAMMRRSPEDITPAMRQRVHRLYRYYESVSRSRRVVEKYCELSYRKNYLRELFPDCILIAIVRRPQAVVCSIDEWNSVHSTRDANWWGVNDRKWEVLCNELIPVQPDADVLSKLAASATGDYDRGLIEWIVGMRAVVSTDEAPLDLVVRYEELLMDPVAEMRRVLEASCLPPSPTVEAMAHSVVRRDNRAQAQVTFPRESDAMVTAILSDLGYGPK